jgi:hypothetical protein
VYFIDLWGDRYTMGYDYGVLLGHMISQCYDTVFYNVFADSGVPPEIIPFFELASELFLDWQVTITLCFLLENQTWNIV